MDIIGALANGAVGGLLGGIGTLAKDIREAITGDMSPEKQAEIAQKVMEIELQTTQAQTLINMEEAKSEHWFVASWRPAVGWIGAISLGYASLVEPFMTWIAVANGIKADFPALDTTITMQILFGILGLGAFRSYDKAQAPNPKGKE